MDIKKYLSTFQFVGSRIVKFTQANDFFSIMATDELDRRLDVEYQIDSIESEKTKFLGILSLNIKVDVKEKSNNKIKKKYKINLTIQGAFSSDIELGREQFEKMLEVNGCASLYAVARAFIMSITSQSLFDGQIILPLLNVVNMVEAKKENTAEKKKPDEE